MRCCDDVVNCRPAYLVRYYFTYFLNNMVQHTMSRYIIEAAVDINSNLVTLVVKGEINEETGVWKCVRPTSTKVFGNNQTENDAVRQRLDMMEREMTDFLVDRRQKIQEGLDTQQDLFSESDYERATDDEGDFGLPAFTSQEEPEYERGRRKK